MKCKQKILVKDKKGYVRRVPCGQCTACRLNRSREWSVRVCREAELYDDVCFLTLTYDDEHLPDYKTLVREHPQKFMKRLRRSLGKPVRFFGCGEYGGQTERPHYHIILFGVSVDDDVFIYDGADGHGFYGHMNEWMFGNIHNKPFDPALADYTAQYTLKKVIGKDAAAVYFETGRIPPFLMFSNRPGIGAFVLDDPSAVNLMGANGFVWHRGKKVPIPRYYRLRGVGKSAFETLADEVKTQQDNLKKFKKARERMSVDDAYKRVYGRNLRKEEAEAVQANENRKFEKRRNKC